jgi:hypothetical protein
VVTPIRGVANAERLLALQPAVESFLQLLTRGQPPVPVIDGAVVGLVPLLVLILGFDQEVVEVAGIDVGRGYFKTTNGTAPSPLACRAATALPSNSATLAVPMCARR